MSIRILAVFLFLPLTLTFTACGGGDNGSGLRPDSEGDGGGDIVAPDTSGPDARDTRDVATGSDAVEDGSDEQDVYEEPPEICIDRVQPLQVVPPAGLRTGFRVRQCDGNPARQLRPSDVQVVNDVTGRVIGEGGEGGAVSAGTAIGEYTLHTVLALDMSNSIFANDAVDDVIDAALGLVDLVVTRQPEGLKHHVSVYAFGRPDTFELIVEADDDQLLADALESLRASEPRGTTDLYGAYIELAPLGLGRWEDGEVFVILITDGTHEAGNTEEMRSQALAARDASTAHIYTIGIEGDYDPCPLEELAHDPEADVRTCREAETCTEGSPPPATCTHFVPDVASADLLTVFDEVAQRIDAMARSNYAIGVCTPVALGSSASITVKISVDGGSAEHTWSYDPEPLNGDTAACNAPQLQAASLSCDDDGLCVMDCTDLEATISTNAQQTNREGVVRIVDDYTVYLANGRTGCQIQAWDLSDSDGPRRTQQTFSDTCPVDIAVAGGYLYASTGEVYDAEALIAGPVAETGCWDRNDGERLRVEGERLYCYYRGNNTLRVVDISDPENPSDPIEVTPTVLGEPNFLEGYSWDVDGNLVYYAGLNGLAEEPGLTHMELVVLDLSDPGTPEVVGSLEIERPLLAVSVEDGLAVLAGPAITLVDVTDPTAPREIGSTDDILFSMPESFVFPAQFDLWRSDDRVYTRVQPHAGADSFVRVFDISNRAAPVHEGRILTWGREGNPMDTNTERLFELRPSGSTFELLIADVADPFCRQYISE